MVEAVFKNGCWKLMDGDTELVSVAEEAMLYVQRTFKLPLLQALWQVYEMARWRFYEYPDDETEITI